MCFSRQKDSEHARAHNKKRAVAPRQRPLPRSENPEMNPYREVVEVEKTTFFMPYAPLVRVCPGGTLLFISGATALPLYHEHPHEHDKLDPPADVRAQARLVMENLKRVLDSAGAEFSDIVRTDVFVVTPMRAARDMTHAQAVVFLPRHEQFAVLPPTTLVGSSDGGMRGQGAHNASELSTASGSYIRNVDDRDRFIAVGFAFDGGLTDSET